MSGETARFLADLHIHSRLSRATSSELTVPSIYRWCQLKGIGLVSTGDFTHHEWMAELQSNLFEDGSGFLSMRPLVSQPIDQTVPPQARRDVKFVISGEISSIYKKNGRTRKVHSLVFMPGLAAAERFSTALGRLGNIKSDGRPIVGLDPMRILELAMDASADAFMIPAHVWTPHFSVFGAMSGFDTIEECFEDLTGHIFAIETGLSSDVTMNRRWSALDRFALTSSSDAHSPAKLGREATILSGEVSWKGLVGALKGQPGPTVLEGTVEFFPEEGKYHADGHRKCGFRCDPAETTRLGGRCPLCGGKLTPGVLGRVEQLADRPESGVPDRFPGQIGLIPLAEILGEILGCGESSNKVRTAWENLIARFGGELDLLGWIDPSEVEAAGEFALAEGLRRMRSGQVFKDAGYDGEYGRIRIFKPGEVEQLQGQASMFGVGDRPVFSAGRGPSGRAAAVSADLFDGRVEECDCGSAEGVDGTRARFDGTSDQASSPASGLACAHTDGLTAEQAAAVDCVSRFVLVVAGPGTGKTRTMVARAAALVKQGIDPAGILVVTFTKRAADEAAGRLAARLGADRAPQVSTFHSFALSRLVDAAVSSGAEPPVIVPDSMEPAARPAGSMTLDELVPTFVDRLATDPLMAGGYLHVMVDEFQDISDDQYRMLELVAASGASLFCVGDPDQSIYGFRGAVPQVFRRFEQDHPEASRFMISDTHRLTPQVAAVASAVLGGGSFGSGAALRSVSRPGPRPVMCRAVHARDEAAWVATTIKSLIGGTGMLDSASVQLVTGLGDIAVLGRTHQALEPVARALEDAGIPFERASDAPLWHHEWMRIVMEAAFDADPMAPFGATALSALKIAGLTPPRGQFKSMLELAASSECGPARDRLALLTEVDAFGLDPEKVRLLTLHASKGLEFENVFVFGCNDGTVPLASGRDIDEDEERRLLFVAVTRAKRALFLSWAASGRQGLPRPSRFLSSMNETLVAEVDAAPIRPRGPVQQTLF